jgi:hypothetical protein
MALRGRIERQKSICGSMIRTPVSAMAAVNPPSAARRAGLRRLRFEDAAAHTRCQHCGDLQAGERRRSFSSQTR